MYAGDSLFTLSPSGQAGVLVIALILSVLTLTTAWLVMGQRSLLIRVAMAVLLLVLFVWASPQVFYEYYRVIIDGLPAQWVIFQRNPLVEAARYASFSGPATLSAHGQGALFWALMLLAVLRGRRAKS